MFCKFCHWVCLWTIGVVGKRRSKKGKSGGRISAFTAPLGSAESGQKKIWPTWQQGHPHQWNMYFPSWWTTAYKQIWLNIRKQRQARILPIRWNPLGKIIKTQPVTRLFLAIPRLEVKLYTYFEVENNFLYQSIFDWTTSISHTAEQKDCWLEWSYIVEDCKSWR